MKIIPFIIFIIIVINVLRRIAEFQRNRPGSDEGWDDGTSPDESSPAAPGPGPRSLPQPSERVRQILEQLAQADRSTAAPAPPPVFRPAPVPVPAPVAPAPLPSLPPMATRRYLSEAEQEAVAEPEPRADETGTPARAAAFADSHVYRQSLAKGFPATPLRGREVVTRHRAPYVLRVKGRQSLRHAIVLSEVLGPPRAFDV